jgi:Predicted Zn-dependent peptidases, insulinase-like
MLPFGNVSMIKKGEKQEEDMVQQSLKVSQNIEGFVVERIQEIPELRSWAYIFSHEKSGARLLHLFNEDPNNLFSIAFRTPVFDNTGVPHILEHSVLGGSRKFPAKDPFQELLKGSLQTFLNALTYPDKTMYPVSSQVEVDFFNLIDVYCDAVFHPLLTKNTFYQEGWHFDVEHIEEPVNIKGIVYNEMKGVFSNFSSHVERKTISQLFPDISYYYESGGIPENITDLSYEQFRAFHALYYHPSNSFIFLYGNVPSLKTLKFLNEKYLAEYDRMAVHSEIGQQPLWSEPHKTEIEAPAPPEDDATATVALSWIFGPSVDPVVSLLGSVFCHYLLGTESSPLRRAIIDSHLGEDLDDITGFAMDFVQSIFNVGLRKTKPEFAPAIEKLIFDTLKKEIDSGLDEELLEGALRQTEFRLREICDAGRFPYNLILAERCYRSWIYGGDPLAYLSFEKNIFALREMIKQGTAPFASEMRKRFLDNKHLLRTVVKASSEMGKRLETQTVLHAQKLSKQFTDEDKKGFQGLTKRLILEQKSPNSPEALATLPKLRKSDLPLKNREVPTLRSTVAAVPGFFHPVFTSGIVYMDLGFDCSSIPVDCVPYLKIYVELASRCGCAGLSFEEMSRKIALATGGIHGSLLCETSAIGSSSCMFKYFLHGKALVSRVPDMLGIFAELLLSPDFTNKQQLKDVLFEMRNDLNSSVANNGHSFAITHAASRILKSKFFDEALDGITQLRFLDKELKEFDADKIIEKLQTLHSIIVNKFGCLVSMTAEDPEPIGKTVEPLLQGLSDGKPSSQEIAFGQQSSGPFGIEISSSVNFVAKAWACRLQDMGPLFVLAKNLSTGYLWNKVRVEGGAYGGMASISAGHPVFSCASYRDPNLVSTLNHFEAGLQQVVLGLPQDSVDQNIIATIGRIDAPMTPHEKGLGETVALLCGRTPQYRQHLRESVLGVSAGTLKRVARQLLEEKQTAVTVIGSVSAFDKAEKEGFMFKREKLLL